MERVARTGVVLAGGRGSRMGAWKPQVTWRGRPLLHHALDALRPLCAEILVLGGPRAAELSRIADGARVLGDPGEGPQVALRHAARAARHATILVAPVDAPRLTPDAYAPLLAAGPNAVFTIDGVADPTIGVYAREDLRRFTGRSLQGLVSRRIDPGALAPQLADADTAEELNRLA